MIVGLFMSYLCDLFFIMIMINYDHNVDYD